MAMAEAERRSSGGPIGPGSGGNVPAFEETKFMKDLIHLRDTQESIQGLSAWTIRNKKAAYKIARCWLKCVKKCKTDHKLTLFHLVNDIVQHSKRKNYTELLEKFQLVLKESMPHLKEPKICEKVVRCLNIWIERSVFEEEFISDLLSIVGQKGAESKDAADILDTFQPTQLCTQIKIMKALEDDTDYKLKTVKEAEINLVDFDDEASLRQNLKDRQHGNDYINEVEESRKRLEQYIKAIDREITKRRQVIDMLTHGGKYYDSLRGEAHIVAQAYSNFGKRVNNLNKKLEERVSELEKNPNASGSAAARLQQAAGQEVMVGPTGSPLDNSSPIPSPDYDAPSPVANEMELELPDEENGAHPPPAATGADSLTSRLETMRDSMSKGKTLQDSAAAASRKAPEEDYNYAASANTTRSQPSQQPQPPPTPHQQPPPAAAEMSISEYLTKLASSESSGPQPSSHQASSYSSGYVPGMDQPPPPLPGMDHQPPYQQPGGGSASSNENSWDWMRPEGTPNGNSANPQQQQPPPPSHGAWGSESVPPAALVWPPPRPDPWAASIQPQQQNEPVPEWQIQPEEEEPPDDPPYLASANGQADTSVDSDNVYTENVALARLQQKQREEEGKAAANNVLIPLGGGGSNAVVGQGSAHASKPVKDNAGNDDDMEMCGDEDADFDSFAHSQLEQNFTQPPPGGRPSAGPPAPPNVPPPPVSGASSGGGPRGMNNKPNYNWVPPKEDKFEESEEEHQKTLSLQDRLRSLAGVGGGAKGEPQQKQGQPAFPQPQRPPLGGGPPPPLMPAGPPAPFPNNANRGRGGHGGPPPGHEGPPPGRGGGGFGNRGGGGNPHSPFNNRGGGGGPSPRGRGGPRPFMNMPGSGGGPIRGGGPSPRGGPPPGRGAPSPRGGPPPPGRGGAGPMSGRGGPPMGARGGGPRGGPRGPSPWIGGPPRGGPRGGGGPQW